MSQTLLLRQQPSREGHHRKEDYRPPVQQHWADQDGWNGETACGARVMSQKLTVQLSPPDAVVTEHHVRLHGAESEPDEALRHGHPAEREEDVEPLSLDAARSDIGIHF